MSKKSANKVMNVSGKRWNNPNWSFGAVVVALLGTFLLLVSLLSRPQIVILHHTVILTQGIVAPAVLMGAIVWAMVEFFTPPGRTIEDLLIRIIPAFIIGAFLGGLLGYMFNFGKYVIEPAFNGNPDALLFLVAVLAAGLAVTWNAAWAHRHGFRGQKSGKAVVITRSESGTSKGARGMLALLIIFIVAILIVPIGAGLGGLFVAGHDSSHVLQDESSVVYITGTSGPVPFGQVNGRITYWCVEVRYLEGSNIPWFVDIAWAHYNRAKYAMFQSVLDDLTTMLKDALLEVAKLKQTGDVKSITEGTRQSRELIEAITSAHRDSIMSVLRKERLTEQENEVYEREVEELLSNPEYLRALLRKKGGEVTRQETS